MDQLTVNLYDFIAFHTSHVKGNAAIKADNSQIFGAVYVVPERKIRILSHAEKVNSVIPNNHIGKTDVFPHSCTHIKRNCLL